MYKNKYNKRAIGHNLELLAGEYLIENGLEIIEYNYFNRTGEIDIVAKDGMYIVFVEVKYRQSDRVQSPSEAVDGKKQRQISLAADQYLLKHKVSEEQLCRFDVVAFLKERPILYKNAFEYQGAKGW